VAAEVLNHINATVTSLSDGTKRNLELNKAKYFRDLRDNKWIANNKAQSGFNLKVMH